MTTLERNRLAINEYSNDGLRLRVAAPPPDLLPYISALYRTEVEDGVTVEDWLPPEEANLRCGKASTYVACIGHDAPVSVPGDVLSGPTDRVTRLKIGGGSFWGIGLTPAGWARFVRIPASEMANRFTAIETSAADQALGRMLRTLREDITDMEEASDLVSSTFRALPGPRLSAQEAIEQVHRTLLSPETTSVNDIVQATAMNPRTFVRFCQRYFGFSPSTLLRRQRFLRSLGKYMLDPSMRWIHSLDTHYWDQAQFIRDFRATMTMTPGEYASLPHPIVGAAVAVTNAATGVAMQALYHSGAQEESETGL